MKKYSIYLIYDFLQHLLCKKRPGEKLGREYLCGLRNFRI